MRRRRKNDNKTTSRKLSEFFLNKDLQAGKEQLSVGDALAIKFMQEVGVRLDSPQSVFQL